MAKASVLDQTEIHVTDLSDEEVLALSNLMGEDQQEELSELLALQREGEIDEAGRERLDELVEEYEAGLLLKSEALVVAVKRGLIPPLG